MFSFATKHNDPDKVLGWGERIGYASGAFGWNMVNGIIGTFLTVYFTNVALLDAAVISTLIAVSKLFDGVSDLIVGRMVDNTKSKLGKARPWLLRMTIPFAISTILLFFVPSGFPTVMKYVYVFVMYNLVNTVFLTAIQVPYYSLISLLTRNAYERGFLGNIQQIFQTLGNVFINSIFTILLTRFSSSAETYMTQQSFTLAIASIMVLMVIANFITVVATKERITDNPSEVADKEEDKVPIKDAIRALLRNKYWVMMFFTMLVVFFVIIFYSIGGVYYAIYVFGDMGQISWMNNAISIAQFAIMFATPFFMKKFGKRPIFAIGMLLLTLGFFGFSLVESNKSLMIFFNALKGMGLGMSGGMAMGLVADTILYGQLKSGINTVGLGNAGVSAAQKIGLGLGQAIFGWVMSGAGFNPALDTQGIAQPETVITAIRMMYNYIPMAMTAVVFVMMAVFFNLEKDLRALKEEKGLVN
ncbi:MFS transporter [Streptococcus sp. S784/96/1]|uniref:MFS transporter n=1 Tax=Streptococcus sp. S784/96/1 TaxID=2653499 RepID=UPI00138A0317|nr:glycoside-pentoside-hexuronide (GPH):cation symporter [Streptococcus sp. S784/96/1]